MKQISIDQIAQKYQAFARSLDCPGIGTGQGNSYAQSEKLYNARKKEFFAKNELQENDLSLVATYNNNKIEGWEYEVLYRKVRADVEKEISQYNYDGECLFDSIFGTNTEKNKRDSLISQLMNKYIGA